MKRTTGHLKDLYQVLGVEASASIDEIKSAYRLLARKYHPDVSEIPDAEERFKEIQQAYRILKDPVERSYYDRIREKAQSEPNFEADQDTYRYWQSPPPARKSFARKTVHGLIVLFWMLSGMMARTLRTATVFLLSVALAVFQWVFPVVAIALIAAGLIFEGNPFHWATWKAHTQLTFLCFGLPVVGLIVAALVFQISVWLAHDGPLFPSLQGRIDEIRCRTLYF